MGRTFARIFFWILAALVVIFYFAVTFTFNQLNLGLLLLCAFAFGADTAYIFTEDQEKE